jgi:hypothetical protein
MRDVNPNPLPLSLTLKHIKTPMCEQQTALSGCTALTTSLAVNTQFVCMQYSSFCRPCAEFCQRSYKPFPYKHRSKHRMCTERHCGLCSLDVLCWQTLCAVCLRFSGFGIGRRCLLLDMIARQASSNRTSCSGRSVVQRAAQ